MGRAGIRAAYATGRGRITLRGRAKIEDIKNRTCIIIEEIPYMVNKKRLIENIADLAKDKRIDGIHTIRDESDKDHDVRIVIELKKDAIAQVVLNHLYQYTQLQDTVGVIMLALVKGEPKILSLKQMLTEYIDFQVEVIRRRTKFDLDKAQARAHILEGMVIAAENIEEVIRICRTSENITEIKQRLMARFSLTEIQADAIAQMRMYQLSNMERKKIDDELAELNAKIKDLTEILASHERVLEIICNELEEIKRKYGDERRTSIENVSGEVDVEDLIPVEDCVVTLTNIGYIKRQPISEYKTHQAEGRGLHSGNVHLLHSR